MKYWVYKDDYFDGWGFVVSNNEEKLFFDTIEEVGEHFGVIR